MKKEAETYFIQFLFCENRMLLQKEFRKLYDLLFKHYFDIYKEGKKARVSLSDIGKKFKITLGSRAWKAENNHTKPPLK